MQMIGLWKKTTFNARLFHLTTVFLSYKKRFFVKFGGTSSIVNK